MCSLWDLIFCHSALGFLDSSCCSVSAVAAVLSWTCSDAFLGIPAGLPLWILGMDWLRHRCASVIFREMLDGSSVVLEPIYTPMRSFKGACCSTSWPALSSITRCTFLRSKWVENNVSLWSLCPVSLITCKFKIPLCFSGHICFIFCEIPAHGFALKLFIFSSWSWGVFTPTPCLHLSPIQFFSLPSKYLWQNRNYV